MDKFIIHGGNKLSGEVRISGAKNASLALMPATLLGESPSVLRNTPDLRDTATMLHLLRSMGATCLREGDAVTIDPSSIHALEAPYQLVKKMRASFYVLGPLVARYGKARVSYPGGCAWGPRPVNFHIEGIRKLGAHIDLQEGYIVAEAQRLHGAEITFDVSSVGATGNVLMAAALARGETVINNAAKEPEIQHLARFLVSMGAEIEGIGTSTLRIQGKDSLHGTDDDNIPDRIEAGTFLVAAAVTGSTITLTNARAEHLAALVSKLEDTGASIRSHDDTISIMTPDRPEAVSVTTAIYPGFPTDMQAQWIALMCLATGTSTVTDTIYHDRFSHVPELQRLGARIALGENTAVINGVEYLTGATVMSTDLRASASLILAGLAARGTTEVLRVYHIDRGYESIEKKLQTLGADIVRVSGKEY